MAKIKTDDLPVDETIGQHEMREIRGGTTLGALSAEQLGIELKPSEGKSMSPAQVAELSELGASSGELASKIQKYNERFGAASSSLSGILDSYHGVVKKIIGSIGQ